MRPGSLLTWFRGSWNHQLNHFIAYSVSVAHHRIFEQVEPLSTSSSRLLNPSVWTYTFCRRPWVTRLKNPWAIPFGNINQDSPRARRAFSKNILWVLFAFILDWFYSYNFDSLMAVWAGWDAKRAKRGVATKLSAAILCCIKTARFAKRTYPVFWLI